MHLILFSEIKHRSKGRISFFPGVSLSLLLVSGELSPWPIFPHTIFALHEALLKIFRSLFLNLQFPSLGSSFRFPTYLCFPQTSNSIVISDFPYCTLLSSCGIQLSTIIPPTIPSYSSASPHSPHSSVACGALPRRPHFPGMKWTS